MKDERLRVGATAGMGWVSLNFSLFTLSGWGTKIPVMLQCAGLMHYRGCFDGRCLMFDAN